MVKPFFVSNNQEIIEITWSKLPDKHGLLIIIFAIKENAFSSFPPKLERDFYSIRKFAYK